MISEDIKNLIAGDIRKGSRARDIEKRFPGSELTSLAQKGCFGVMLSVDDGGLGWSAQKFAELIIELAKADGTISTIVSSHNTLIAPILASYGNKLQREQILPEILGGKSVSGFALTEPQSGSDAFNVTTTAELKDGAYTINGEKQFITSGKNADFILTVARTDLSSKGVKGLSLFIVPTKSNGFNVKHVHEKMGQRSSDTCHLSYENVELQEEYLVGDAGEAYAILSKYLPLSRLGIASQAYGMAEAAYQIALEYAQSRVSFSKPIISHQIIGAKFAELATSLHAASLLINDLASKFDEKQGVVKASSMTKLFVTETAEKVVRECMQILGGYGYVSESGLEQIYRDVRACTIYEGTSDIHKLIILNELLIEGHV